MRLNSTGLGIGTSSPSAKLHVSSPDGTAPLTLNTAGGADTTRALNFNVAGDNYGKILVPSASGGAMAFWTGAANSAAERMRITSAGDVGIGLSSSLGTGLSVNGTIRSQNSSSNISYLGFTAYTGTGASGLMYSYIGGDGRNTGYLTFNTVDAERARIDSSGNLLMGKTASSGTTAGIEMTGGGVTYFNRSASTNGDTTLHVYSTGASAFRFYVGMGGTVYATSTTISAISDIRYKENVRDLDVGLNAVMALKPRLYDWKEGKGADIKNARGFIAQEFEEVFPDLIDEWKDPAPEGEEPYKSVRQDLIPVLVKAIQEQNALIQSLKARLDAANL
jgi:hypothetical protein